MEGQAISFRYVLNWLRSASGHSSSLGVPVWIPACWMKALRIAWGSAWNWDGRLLLEDLGACPGKTLGFGLGGPRGGALPAPPCCWGLNPGGNPWGGNPCEFWGNNPDGSLG